MKGLNIIFLSILFAVFIPLMSAGQTKEKFELYRDEYCTFIRPTLRNAIKLLFMSNGEFEEAMREHNYTKTATGQGYMVSTTTRSHFRVITKDSRSLLMFFGPNISDLVTQFRKNVAEAVKNPTPSFENDYEIYRLTIPYEGINFNVQFGLKDSPIEGYSSLLVVIK